MMSDKKTIFVCEFITAGGFVGQVLSAGLVSEGSLMRDQLCHELDKTGQYALISMHDARLKPPPNISNSLPVERDFELAFTKCLKQADLVWLIAPECDDILLKLTRQCEAANVPLIGVSSEIVELATDKLNTAAWLASLKVNTPMSLPVQVWKTQLDAIDPQQPWLAKPIKGVGCEGIVILPDGQAVSTWLTNQPNEVFSDYFLQAQIQHAQPASLCMVCHDGRGFLLSCNRLIVKQNDRAIKLKKIIVNGFAVHWVKFQALADTIASQLPDMRAYLGVDVMFDEQAGTLSVLELNPRLSSSYVGLANATGQNVAQCLLDAYYQSDFKMPEILRQQVTLNLE